MTKKPERYFLKDDGVFPNSSLPVLYYRQALRLPPVLPALWIRKKFAENNWTNSWKQGIFSYHHYHSTSHEVLGICNGETLLQLGGEEGLTLFVEKGDVLVIPAGVAHMNLGKENDVICVGAYPDGRTYDMKFGKKGERPEADESIEIVPLPSSDPLYGKAGWLRRFWR